MSKRIISLALTVIMLAALLPAAFLSASAADTLPRYQICYTFVNGKYPHLYANQPMSEWTFENTTGRMQFAGASAGAEKVIMGGNQLRYGKNFVNATVPANPNWFALNINVPVAGEYNLSVDYYWEAYAADDGGKGGTSKIYVIPSEVKLDSSNIDTYRTADYLAGEVSFEADAKGSYTKANINGDNLVTLVKGINTIICSADSTASDGTYAQPFSYIYFETPSGEGYATSFDYSFFGKILDGGNYRSNSLVYNTKEGYGTEHSVYAVYCDTRKGTTPALGIARGGAVSNSSYASISGASARAKEAGINHTVTITGARIGSTGNSTADNTSVLPGLITIIESDLAEAYFGENAATANETPTYDKTFVITTDSKIANDANVYYASADGTTFAYVSRPKADQATGLITLSAEAKRDDLGVFMYWATGLSGEKKILSTSSTFKFQPDGSTARPHIIAVYDGTGTSTDYIADTLKAEIYNADGQLLETIAADEDGNITLPPYPTMYGKTAIGWLSSVSGTSYVTEDDKFEAGETVNLDGTTVFVAAYNESDIYYDCEITVTGSTTDGTLEKKFGDEVELTANVPDGQVFKWWKKDGEIVSINSSYTFYAWEDCTVEAVFGTTTPLFYGPAVKVIVDTFGNDTNNVMVEFTGLEDAVIVEKGIIIGSTEYHSYTQSKQMTIYDDTGAGGYANVSAYVIFRQSGLMRKVTGTASVAAE